MSGADAAWAAIEASYPGKFPRPTVDEPTPDFVERPQVQTADDELTAAMLDGAPHGYAGYARSLLPVDLRDQLQAAENDASALVDSLRNVSAAAPGWLRWYVLDLIAQWVHGKTTTCAHCPSPLRPQPVFAATYRPGHVVCAKCLYLLKPSRAERFICDGCRRDCEGDVMHEFGCKVGPFIVLAGTCRDCTPPEITGPE